LTEEKTGLSSTKIGGYKNAEALRTYATMIEEIQKAKGREFGF
jgi:hypothetical protein